MSSFSRKQKDVEHWLFRTVCKVTVGDVTKNFSRVLALDHNTTIAEAFGITEELLIQSVAVTGPPELFRGLGGGDGVDLVAGGKQYIGESSLRLGVFFCQVVLCSNADIFYFFFLTLLCKIKSIHSGIVSVLDMLAYSLKHEDFLTHVLSDVIGSTDESQTFWCEDTDQPLYFALEQFVKGVHHALVQDSNDEEGTLPLKFLAQTDILRFLTSDPTALPHLKMLLEQPVGAVSTPCAAVSVSLATPLREAIALLREHSSLPVANEAGVIDVACMHAYAFGM